MPARQSAEPDLITFDIELMDVQPRVWRQFQVPSNLTFSQLHQVIQVVMGWEDYHLYCFRYGPIQITIPDGELFVLDSTHFDARYKRLSSLKLGVNDFLQYQYDMGDDWIHLLRVRFIQTAEFAAFMNEQRMENGTERGAKAPAIQCLEGEHGCPPEDIGGPYGYEHYLEVMSNPKDEEYEDLMAWHGKVKLKEFDLIKVNKELMRTFKKK